MMNEHEQRECLIFAFRYALGRRSTASYTLSELVKKHLDVLNNYDKQQICDDIAFAIKHSEAGMECDVAIWKALKQHIEMRMHE